MSDIIQPPVAPPTPSIKKELSFPAVLVLAGLILPVLTLSALGTWWLFSIVRVKRKVIATGLAAYVVLTIWLFPISVDLFSKSFSTLTNMFSKDFLAEYLSFILQQSLLSIPIGVIIGLVYASYRWAKRPEWVEVEFRPTPLQKRMKKKNISDIKNDLNGPIDGATLGIDKYGNRIVQTDREAAVHTLVVGASGSGKTTTLMSRARDSIRLGGGMVFIDLKGGNDVPTVLARYAKRYDREFFHWTMQGINEEYNGPDPLGPAHYDPIGRGNASRRQTLLVETRPWSEAHYKLLTSNYLLILFGVMLGNPRDDISTLADVVELLEPQALSKRADALRRNPIYAELVESVDRINEQRITHDRKSSIDGLRSLLEIILHSVAGQWLKLDPNGNRNINLKEAAHKGQVIVFSLDSSNYADLAGLVANLIIQDLKTVSSELRDEPARLPLQIYIDEFSSIGSTNVVSLINKSRDAGMPVTLATQALADLRREDPEFLNQLLAIISNFIIHRANKDDDALVYAGLGGKEIRKRFRQNVSHSTNKRGLGIAKGTGGGTIEEIEDFRISPNEIQDLNMGEMVYVSKSPSRIERVFVIPEDGISTEPDRHVSNYSTSSFKLHALKDLPSLPKIEPTVQEVMGNVGTTTRLSNPERLKNILNNDETEIVEIKSEFIPREYPLPESKEETNEISQDYQSLTTYDSEPETIPKTPPQTVFPKPIAEEAKPTQPSLPRPPSKPEIDFGKTKQTEKDEFDF